MLCLGQQRRGGEAVPFAEAAVQIDPTNAAALGNLASCLLESGETERARKTIGRALDLEPKDAINLRTQAMIESKNPKKKPAWKFW